MRILFTTLAAAMVLGLGAEPAKAWHYPYGYYAGGFAVNPYIMPPAYSASTAYALPYGYSGFFNSTAYPGPWGYNTLYNYGNFVSPYATGPFHSVIYNPFQRRYQYGPGYLNSPVFLYQYGFPY